LLQERLVGPEFVVDAVTRAGVTKVVAVFKYDKREANGAPFVYFGMDYVSPADAAHRWVYPALVEFNQRVLRAVGITQGPSHLEAILTASGPVLVEVAARPQGSSGAFVRIAEICAGYSQVTATVAAYAPAGDSFERLPAVPPAAKAFGRVQDLVSGVAGTLQRLAHLDEVCALPSFHGVAHLPELGTKIGVTCDLFSSAGIVLLAHESEEVLRRDALAIEEFCSTMFVVGSP
jgi:hypothetical protein